MRFSYVLPLLVVCICGCAKSGTEPSEALSAVAEDPPAATFRILAHDAKSDSFQQYVVDAGDQLGDCQFKVTIQIEAQSTGSPFTTANAKFEPIATKDCGSFLRRLARAMAYEGDFPSFAPAETIVAPAALIGSKQSRLPGGGYTDNPDGPWELTKVFLSDEGGEFFLNFNLEGGVGEFSMKDPEFAAEIVTRFGELLAR